MAALVLLAGVSAGQPPAAPPDPTDALIQKALANDPDVQVARAKLALAEAEVAKARQVTVGRVVSLRAVIDQHRAELAVLGELVDLQTARRKAGAGAYEEVLAAQAKLTTARAALARSETDLRLLTGDGPKLAVTVGGGLRIAVPPLGVLPPDQNPDVLKWYVDWFNNAHSPKVSGPIPDRIRAALDKKVRLGNKGDGISLDAAMEVFKKEAGLDVPIRPTPSPMPRIVLDGEELPIGAWFQMFQDHGGHRDGFAFYVRDYGLLVANRQTAPPDAMTLTEFWHTRPAAQADPKLPVRKRYDYAHDKLAGGLKAKAGETIVITFPVKTDDVEDSKVGSDTPAVVARVETQNGMVVVAIRAERAGKARVTWDISDATGRRFTERGREVEFE